MWTSLHLYIPSLETAKVDDFLQRIVIPTAEALVAAGETEDYFFVRYRDEAPHVRLRLRATQALTERIKSHREALLDSSVARSLGLSDVRIVAYEPEVERYGGPLALPHAEEFFVESTQIACLQIAEASAGPLRPTRRLGHLALAMTVAVACIQSDPLLAAALLSGYSAGYASLVATPRHAPALLERYDAAFERQAALLVPSVHAAFDCIQRGKSLEATALVQFERAARRIVAALKSLWEQGALHGSGMRDQNPQHAIWRVVTSLLHMHGNRMGCSIVEEAYTARLASQALRSAIAGA